MMLRAVATLVLLCVSGPLPAQEPQPKIEGETKVQTHTLARLKAEGVCVNASIVWDVWPFDAKVDVATTPKGVFEFAAPPGTYTIQMTAYSITEQGLPKISRARVTVTVEGDKPAPPKPPDPDPTPPVPPVPPTPTDPLAKELAVLYAAETAATKRPDLLLLIELFTQAVELAGDQEIRTLSSLSFAVAKAGKNILPPSRLEAMRRRIAAHVAGEFGEEEKELTPEARAKAKEVYGRVLGALKQIGGAN